MRHWVYEHTHCRITDDAIKGVGPKPRFVRSLDASSEGIASRMYLYRSVQINRPISVTLPSLKGKAFSHGCHLCETHGDGVGKIHPATLTITWTEEKQ